MISYPINRNNGWRTGRGARITYHCYNAQHEALCDHHHAAIPSFYLVDEAEFHLERTMAGWSSKRYICEMCAELHRELYYPSVVMEI